MTSAERARAAEELRHRTKQFALRVIRLTKALPREDEAQVVERQLLRSGTSVGANYRAVCRARSAREFVSKMGVVVEEADETAFWIELLIEGQIVRASLLTDLLRETNELLAIFAASYHTARRKSQRPTK